ncbi:MULTISPECIES: FadR/GntR family transcriptional regulator [Edwardsiella]|uniref:GntR domain protein n=2 Tax=Edwardsiella anguillarum TaxID=1821960 RepID=A0A076LSZ2_9GAMM|nr:MULTISPECIES: FadR/GntR family transcriptional regulator [Edwardsiella]AIJ09807.1 GntR domain protein [Edwardsiella anguillarum ET080813]KAB0585859.1 FadR family transcriptional regulator [Edwardsiella anguillarum]UBU94965.1 FadR family transcriptional regulator [Edwardsiella sp. LADL05-105]UOU80553.1 FadR family transcriptional regulator [Edwardsiella anguillarum]WHP81608.1 FadR family transcriptional regulator [Edwardsiella anguillarum]
MSFEPIENKKTYQYVAERIEAKIVSGEFSLHQRLPAERELARILHVSRNVVREALLSLELAGYVVIKHGVGSIVASKTPITNSILLLNKEISPTHLMSVRRVVDAEIAGLAALNATPSDIEQLKEALNGIMSNDDYPSPDADWVLLFHKRLASATDNPVWSLINDQIWQLMRTPLLESFRLKTKIYYQRKDRQAYRKQIITCIEERNSSGARDAMIKHVESVTSFFFDEVID